MSVFNPTPPGSWSLVVMALAELGRTEIERRQHAAEVRAEAPVADDQIDDGRGALDTPIEATKTPE